MSRSVRLGEEPGTDAEQLAAAVLTRIRRKCIAEGAHQSQPPDAADPTTCPRCGL